MGKALGMSPKEVLHSVSYANLLLLGASIPSYTSKKHGSVNGTETIDADDPANANKILAIINQSHQ